jgi:hypothetical protein
MASDTTPGFDSEGQENLAEPRRLREAVTYDSGLAPTCMIWFVFIGLGLLMGAILIWGIGHFDAIAR